MLFYQGLIFIQMKFIFSIGLLSVFFQACKPYDVLKKMNSEDAKLEWWGNSEGKSVGFISMVHAGQAQFYKNVHDSIIEYKRNGYTVFYESVKLKEEIVPLLPVNEVSIYFKYPEVKIRNVDTLTKLVYLLKLRRMVGMIPDSASYSTLIDRIPLVHGAIMQPSWTVLGVTNSDVNADIGFDQIVNRFQEKFGPIKLAQIDFAVPLNSILPSSLRLNKKKARSIIIGYRNLKLAESIQNSKLKKIIVVYGADHKNGTLKNLKKLNPSWVKRN
jgi:hypothetical protein